MSQMLACWRRHGHPYWGRNAQEPTGKRCRSCARRSMPCFMMARRRRRRLPTMPRSPVPRSIAIATLACCFPSMPCCVRWKRQGAQAEGSSLLRARDNPRDEAVSHGVIRPDPEIAVGIVHDLFVSLSCLARDDAVDALAHLDDLFGLDGDVGSLARHAAQRLMQQEARVWKAETVLLFRAQENMRAGARHPAGADHLHLGTDVADHVVDGVARLHMAARRIDDHPDVAGTFRRIGDQLAADSLRDLHIDLTEYEDGPGLEQRHLHGGHGLFRLHALAFLVFLLRIVVQPGRGNSCHALLSR